MERERIQVYADKDTKRRIELAAAKRDVPVTQYCLEAIRQQLAEDDVLEVENVLIQITSGKEAQLVEALRALQHRIKARRGGQLIDVERALEETRQEREYELTNLH
ncbi:MAG: hypothetical protein ACUVWR_18765 [Anaerolineae bacterium]